MISLRHISKSFSGNEVLTAIDLRVNAGETYSIIGPSGSGKSTILKIINGLIEPDQGEVRVFDQKVDAKDSVELRRKIGFVLQQPALFPHLTVRENVEVVPKLLDWKAEQRKARTDELLDLLGLETESFAERYPSELSGGQQQRVGIARALAADPDLILFDEPFSALDPITRGDLQNEVLRLKEKFHKTTVFVTHDIREAFLLGDQVVVLNEGKIVQSGTPSEIEAAPANDFVKRFIETGDA
ncbi:MAG: ABC transporter ATP-binding protein [Cryomorphaceae bacterium]